MIRNIKNDITKHNVFNNDIVSLNIVHRNIDKYIVETSIYKNLITIVVFHI